MSSQDASPIWRTEYLQLAIDAASVALWSWQVDTDHFTMDARAFELWGLAWSDAVAFEGLSAHIHPADRDRVRAAFSATRSVAGPYEIDFRILVDNDVRWISARGQGADQGMVDGVLFGIFLDVTGPKQAEEGHELLAGEMSHRVKNLLAIASGLTRITSQSTTSIAEMAEVLTERLTALVGRTISCVHSRVTRVEPRCSATCSRYCSHPMTPPAPSPVASGWRFPGWGSAKGPRPPWRL